MQVGIIRIADDDIAAMYSDRLAKLLCPSSNL